MEQDPAEILAEQTLEGFVNRVFADSHVADFQLPSGEYVSREFMAGELRGPLPRVGRAVRLTARLTTAADLETEPGEPLPPLSDDYLRMKPTGPNGEYRLGGE